METISKKTLVEFDNLPLTDGMTHIIYQRLGKHYPGRIVPPPQPVSIEGVWHWMSIQEEMQPRFQPREDYTWSYKLGIEYALKYLQIPKPQAAQSSGDAEINQQLARVTHERDLLAKAIGDAALKAKIWNGEVPLTGPQLLMLADDLADCALKPTAHSSGVAEPRLIIEDNFGSQQLLKDIMPNVRTIDIRVRMDGKYYWFEGDYLKEIFPKVEFQQIDNDGIKSKLDSHLEIIELDEEAIEHSYWRFDAKHKGLSQWKSAPMSERDAYKSELRNVLSHISQPPSPPAQDDAELLLFLVNLRRLQLSADMRSDLEILITNRLSATGDNLKGS